MRDDRDRYEDVKNDYYQSLKARDERPALVPNFQNYFASDPKSPKGRD
jgi:hypothetical protein